MIYAWTDGSGVWDPSVRKPIGYATVFRVSDYVLELAAWCPAGTNNRAELSAAIIALQALNVEPCLRDGVMVISDSEYVIGQATKSQRTNLNHDLVAILQRLSDERKAQWRHVRGHTGDWGNERCDVLASWARKRPLDPATQQAQIVHCSLYHHERPEEPLLLKGTKDVSEVFTGDEWLKIRLLV